MRLATITNWAYGVTVALTLAAGAAGVMAYKSQETEREAVARHFALDRATSHLGEEAFVLSNAARLYVMNGDPGQLIVHDREAKRLLALRSRTASLREAGANADELAAIQEIALNVEQLVPLHRAAVAARQEGDAEKARTLLFGSTYERDVERLRVNIINFERRLDERTVDEVQKAAREAKSWRTVSEITLGATALLFLCVLYFILKQRILRPVVRLSDVVTRLAAEDFEVALPDHDEIDEIGDISKAIRVFQETGLQRRRLEHQRANDLRLRELLSLMTQRMQACDTAGGVAEVVKRFTPEIAPGMAGRLFLMDKAHNALVQACEWGDPAHSVEEFSPLSCWALRRGAPHRTGREAVDVPCAHLGTEGAIQADTICLPLTAQQETIGLIYLEAPCGGADGLGDAYIKMLAENVALALSNLRLRDALQAMALADPLTGLANRRQLDARLKTLLAETEETGAKLGCLMIDVDYFKRFNDDYGHDAGDAVLREVGGVLSHATREQGLAFRFGGEEFVVLLPGFDASQTMDRAETIRTRIAELKVRNDGQDLGPITASIGVALTPDQVTPHNLLHAADAALLRAKQAGRNQVQSAVRRGKRQTAA